MSIPEIFGDYTADGIASEADTETISSFPDAITQYEENDISYIPLPNAGKYYSLEADKPRDLLCELKLSPDSHLFTALKRLSNHPFLLLNYQISVVRERAHYVSSHHDETVPDYGIITLADVNRVATRRMLESPIAEVRDRLARETNRFYTRESPPQNLVSRQTLDSWEVASRNDRQLSLSEYMTLEDFRNLIPEDDLLLTDVVLTTKNRSAMP